ncbi:hypothetical protein BASA61_006449 [Batrachochytrium salamandrivorans]|nr:hypothetical protein BASA61_006449 [Batrachochytrium salamandrivorans]
MIDDVTKDHHLASHHELTEAIQRNQASRQTPFAMFPVAVVRLETGDHPPVYRRQYPIPFNVHDQVKEQIEEWVQTGKVTDAPIGCQYNNPLLVVPKKDLEGKTLQDRLHLGQSPSDVRRNSRSASASQHQSSNAQCHSCFEDRSALTLSKMTFQSVLSHLNNI